jgi:hypothetical protein
MQFCRVYYNHHCTDLEYRQTRVPCAPLPTLQSSSLHRPRVPGQWARRRVARETYARGVEPPKRMVFPGGDVAFRPRARTRGSGVQPAGHDVVNLLDLGMSVRGGCRARRSQNSPRCGRMIRVSAPGWQLLAAFPTCCEQNRLQRDAKGRPATRSTSENGGRMIQLRRRLLLQRVCAKS